MSARQSIVNALVTELKKINGTGDFTSNVFDNVTPRHKFWDECNDFPTICVVSGYETREYLPGDFRWGHLNISLKLYVKGEDPSTELETLVSDVESILNISDRITYSTSPLRETAKLTITSIATDEGLLVPYGIGEVNISIQYQVL